MSSLQISCFLVNWDDCFLKSTETTLESVENAQHVLGHVFTAAERFFQQRHIVHFLCQTNGNESIK